jgi:hypothetical protein
MMVDSPGAPSGLSGPLDRLLDHVTVSFIVSKTLRPVELACVLRWQSSGEAAGVDYAGRKEVSGMLTLFCYHHQR